MRFWGSAAGLGVLLGCSGVFGGVKPPLAGMRMVYRAPPGEDLDAVARQIEERLSGFGQTEYLVRSDPPDQVIVEVGGTEMGNLPEDWAKVADLRFIPAIRCDGSQGATFSDEFGQYCQVGPPILNHDNVVDAWEQMDEIYGEPVVHVTFDPAGATSFEVWTGANVGQPLLIVVDGRLKSAPIVRDAIPGGHAVITFGSSQDAMAEATSLVAVLKNPVTTKLELVSMDTFGP